MQKYLSLGHRWDTGLTDFSQSFPATCRKLPVPNGEDGFGGTGPLEDRTQHVYRNRSFGFLDGETAGCGRDLKWELS